MFARPPRAAAMAALLLAATALAPALATPALAASAPAAPSQGADIGGQPSAASCAPGTGLSTSGTSENLSLSTWTAPGAAWADLQSASDVRAALDTGLLTPASAGADRYEDNVVATGDVVLHRLRVNGSAMSLLDRLAAQDTGSPTTNFQALAREDGIEFRYLGPTACPPTLALNASIDAGAFRVIPDRDAGALSLVVDVGRLHFHPPGGGDPEADWDWGHHGLELTLAESTGLVDEDTTVGADYDVDDRHVEVVAETDGLLRVAAAPNQRLAGVATMAPGTTVTLELVALDAPTTTAHATTATLDRNGTFATTLDLSNDSDAVYRVRVPETPRQDAPYALVAVDNATGAELAVSDQDGIGTHLYATGVTTTHGGFIVARNDTTTVAVSDFLSPGAASPQPRFDPVLWADTNLTVTVYRDSDGDGTYDPGVDDPYTIDGAPVTDTAHVVVDVSERETTRTTTHPTTTTQPTTATGTRQASSSTPHTTDARTPGFGPLVTLVALLAVLAGRPE